MFVRNRGNLKDMEQELNVSYWAIRNRLQDVVAEMDQISSPPPVPDPGRKARRRDILERLNKGEITVAEAADLLSQP